MRRDNNTLPCQIGQQGSVLGGKLFTLLRFPSRLFKGGFGKRGRGNNRRGNNWGLGKTQSNKSGMGRGGKFLDVG